MRRSVVALVAVLAFFVAASCVRPSPPPSLAGKVDRLFAEWNKPDAPGCSVAVSRNGARLYEHGYGSANLELRAPITPATVLAAGSISKQFTAFAILLLARRAKLSLDDDVGKYIPDWQDHGARITIRQLLSHTSGLRDAFLLQGLRPDHPENINQQIVSILAHTRRLNFAPGTQFEYNNGAYTVLATIVAHLSGQTFPEFVAANVFKPLEMTHSLFRDDAGQTIVGRGMPYVPAKAGFRIAIHTYTNEVLGNDGLYTTPGDLLRWEQNFDAPRVGDAALLREMETPVIATGWPDQSAYGYGIEIAHDRGLLTVGHSGGDEGVSTYVVRYPERALAIAVMCNRDDVDAASVTRSIATIALNDAFPQTDTTGHAAAPVTKPVTLPVKALDEKVGLYRSVSDGSIGRVFIRDGTLVASGSDGGEYELTPLAQNGFVIKGTSVAVAFVPPEHGKPQELRVTLAPGAAPQVSQLIARSYEPREADLRPFEGTYTSDEIDGVYAIAATESRLLLRVPTRDDIELSPVSPDTFVSRSLGTVTFSRDARGVVTAFAANAPGLRGLRFTRAAEVNPLVGLRHTPTR